MLREKDWKNVRRTRKNRLFCFTGQICAGLSWLFDTRKFFSFPRARCIDLFLPPCFSSSDEGERNVPDKSGKRKPSGSRRRRRRSSCEDRETKESSGIPEKRRGRRRRLEEDGKERIAKERQPLFAITERCGLSGTRCKNRGHWIAVRSVVPMRFVWDGSTDRIRCGFAIEK